MSSTDGELSLAQVFHAEFLLARRDRLLARDGRRTFAAPDPALASYWETPTVASPCGAVVPEPESEEAFASRLVEVWRARGVDLPLSDAARVARLAWQLKHDDAYDAQPTAFIYTL